MGLFITFEGIEGCGKTTQIALLKAELAGRGLSVITLREPGGTELGELIRPLLLSSGGEGPTPLAELMLYGAARAEITKKRIRPALEDGNGKGEVVICDRFIDSTIAYQGHGRGLDLLEVEAINKLATGGLKPDITILLDLDPSIGLKRAWERIEGAREGLLPAEDRFEREDIDFHARIREGFLDIAQKEPDRVKVVDASKSPEEVFKTLIAAVDSALS